MRLHFVDGHYEAHFTMIWEIEQLSEREGCWVAFSLPGKTEAIGEIHGSTHEVRLFPGVIISQRQVVNLRPSE